MRVGKTVDGTATTYLQDVVGGLPHVLLETTGGSQTLYVYGLGLAFQVNADGSHRYYHADSLGTTRVVTDDAGNPVSAYNYDAYGALRQSAGEGKAFTFTGEQLDTETSYFFLRARTYDPQTGRFLQRDPVLTANRYAYAGGNPLRYADPAGADFQDAWEFLQGVSHGYTDSVSFGTAAGFRNATGVYAPDSDYYYLGRTLGDVGGIITGVGTAGSGMGGVLLSPATGPPAPAVAVISGARVVLGTAITANSGSNASSDLSNFFAKRRAGGQDSGSQRHVNSAGKEYPVCRNPGTGQEIPFPEGDLTRVPVEQRAPWSIQDRAEFIRQWHENGYDEPPGGWEDYDIHHIRPREFGGSNDFSNLVPVERGFHHDEFDAFWRDYP